MLETSNPSPDLLSLLHPRLMQHLKPGMQVLDVGCGDGGITAALVPRVTPGGGVVGFDVSPPAEALQEVPHLEFVTGEVDQLPFQDRFDLVNARKLLMWQSKPLVALEQMVKAAAPGGKVMVLEPSRQAMIWQPALPPSVQKYHAAFLEWRRSQGFDDAIGEQLPELFRKVGLVEILIAPVHKRVTPQDPHFMQVICQWLPNSSGFADQVVAGGYLSALEQQEADQDFAHWWGGFEVSVFSPLVTVEGTKPY
jgi:ubiquinone/menaquinone biosynthesis C-methylase UbiE